MTSKLRNYISSPAPSVSSTHEGYSHLLVGNLKSNIIDETPCSREGIFSLWHWCSHPFMVICSKADNPLRHCSNRILTEVKETNQSCSASGFLLRCPGHVIFSIYLIFSSGGMIRDFLVNYQTELFKLLRPFHSWDYGALAVCCQVKLHELLRAPPNQLLHF